MANAIDLRGLVRPQLVESTKRDDNPNVAEFRIQPLERGFGHTLGNAMRRMLLSSLRGSAVWGFRVDGVVHEHQTIAGVVEDVHQIIANLKTLTLTLPEGKEEDILRVVSTGAGRVTAGNINATGGVSVIDTAHHLFTVQDGRNLQMELYVKKGRGYVESDQHGVDRNLPVDLVRIDSIFNPVRRANFTVAETRVGQRTDYDRLTMTVETNGAITPEEAVSYAAALAQTHFQYFVSFGSFSSAGIDTPADGFALDGRALAQRLETRIDDLGLSQRARNSLMHFKIATLRELVEKNEAEILGVKNFGKKSLEEVAAMLEKEGLAFGMRFEAAGEGSVRIVDHGTPPRRAAEAAADEAEESDATP